MPEQPFPGVTGFFTPVFSEDTASGRQNHGLTADDFHQVVAGYGCARCLAKFDLYMVACPVCNLERDVAADVSGPPPELWTQHLAERHRDDAPATQVPTFDDFMATIRSDSDIDHVPMSKLARHTRKRVG